MRAHVVAACFLIVSSASASADQLTKRELAIIKQIKGDPDKAAFALAVLSSPESSPKSNSRELNREPKGPVRRSTAYTDDLANLVRKREPRDQKEPLLAVPLRQYSDCAGFTFLLRKNWKDIGFLGCPDPVDKAVGAELSFSDDLAARNRILTVNGTAAMVYTSLTADPPEWWLPYYKTFAAYGTANRTLNSSVDEVGSNVAKLAYGVAAEVGYSNDFGGNYLRLRGGGIEDSIRRVSSSNVTAEYIPVFYPAFVHTPIPATIVPVIVRYDPSFLIQYARASGFNQTLAFNGRNEALRVGPQVKVNFFPAVDPQQLLFKDVWVSFVPLGIRGLFEIATFTARYFPCL